MKQSQGSHLAALCLLGFTAAPAAHQVAFEPEAGTRWQRSIDVTSNLEFDELSVSMGGRPVPSQFLPVIEMDHVDRWHLEATDVLGEVGEGYPRSLRRTYDEAWREAEQEVRTDMGQGAMSTTSHGEGRSPLEGVTVEFEWEARDEAPRASLVDEDGDPELVEGLYGDLDLLAWLPEDEVEVGASWDVSGAAFVALLEPGGDLAIELEGENVEEFERGVARSEDEVSGELTLLLEKVTDEDGSRVARIAVEGQVRTESSHPGDLKHVPVADGTTTVEDTAEYDVEGHLVWDLDFGMLRRLDLNAELDLSSHDVKDPGQSGPDYESTATLYGTVTIEIRVEPAE